MEDDIEAIYGKYVDDLFSFGVHLGFSRHVVMDAIHDVFYKMCSEEDFFDGVGDVRLYLRKSLKNKLLDLYRQKKAYVDLDAFLDAEDFSANAKNTVEESLIHDEEMLVIRKKIDGMLEILSERQREIVYFRFVKGFAYDEIAEIMGINSASCRKLVHKAMEKLRKNAIFFVFPY